jgi:integrase
VRQSKPWYRKQTNSWYVQINGKQFNLGRDRSKAFEEYHRLMSGQSQTHSDILAHSLIDQYVDWMEVHRAQSTVAIRKLILASFQSRLPKSLRADQLRPFHVMEWLVPAHSSTTQSDRITIIKTVWNWGVSMGYLATNPIEKMPKPQRKVRQDFLPVERWPELLGAATDLQFKDFLSVMLLTGARTQEMLIFKAKHFDGARLILPIEQSKGRKRSRVIYLPSEALAIIERLAHQHPEGTLFRNSRGRAWTRNSVRIRFRRLKEILGMPSLCSTTLRHSYAHYRLTSGQDALTVAKLMGHVDTRMLSTRYGHLEANIDYMQKAADKSPTI